jgi:NADPH:quinone reductase-like Zn-dependent oxidoreductase
VAPKPQTLDHVHAAAVPRAGLTAWQALFDHGKLAKGQTVVIHGAGGAVGSMAVQLALLKPGDTLVTIKADALPPSRDDIRTVVFIQESSRAQLTELARLVDQGHLRPQVGAVYPLAQAVKAYSAKAAGGIPGRIVLQP